MTTENGSPDGGNPADNNGGSQSFDFGGAVETVENEELKGWIQNKGFDSVDKMATSYRNLEQLMGADKAGRTIVKPGEGAEADEMNQFYNALGRPESADGYGFNAPEGADPEFAGWAKGVFHEAGLTDSQAAMVADKWNEYVGERGEQSATDYNNSVEEDDIALRKEWGAAYDKNMGIAKAAAREFGLDGETIDAMESSMGFGKLMQVMNKIGQKVGEDSFEGGGNRSDGFTPITPQQAMAQISDLKHDTKFRERLLGGDKDAQAQWDRLHRNAYGSE